MLVLSLATSAYAYLLGPALSFLFTGDPGPMARLGRFLPESLDLAHRMSTLDRSALLNVLPALIVGLALVKGVAFYGQQVLMATTGQKIIADLRRGLFDHLLRLSPAFFTRRHSGDIMQRFSADVLSVELAVTNAVTSYLRDGLTVMVMLVSCFLLDWKMSLVAFGAVPITL